MHTREYAKRVQERQGRLYRLAFCYVKHQQDALDIVSDSVYRGLIHLYQLREPDQFDAWMDRIVVHAALDYLRKKGRVQLAGEETLSLLPADEASLTAEESMDLYHALDLLSPEDRTYILLRFFREYSFREMSEILEQPESTIKSRLYRILGKLREQLTE